MKENINARFGLKGKFKAILKDLDGNILQIKEVGNLVVQVAKIGFAKIMNDEAGFTGKPNYLAVGTGANAPSSSDTTLQTELARTTIVPATNVRTNEELTMEFYFGPTEANGSIKEIGVFIDGTASADTGTLFDRALLDITKDVNNSLTLVFTVTVI